MWWEICNVFKDNKDEVLNKCVIDKKKECFNKGFIVGFKQGVYGGISLSILSYSLIKIILNWIQ